MSDTTNYFKQSELALAAYADLGAGAPNIGELIKGSVGMTQSQAERFARDWRVVEQYNHTELVPVLDEFNQPTGEYTTTSNGLSVTVFQEVSTGRRYLAIRGTEATSGADLWTDFKDLISFGTPEHQSQYQSLKAKVTEWIGNGTLPSRFTIAGHSLGGFLSAAVAIDFPLNVEHAYLYNAPGAGGVRANLELALQILGGLPDNRRTLDLGVVSNLRAASGASLIAGLGQAWGIPVNVEIEAAPGLGLDNHSMVRLTDALAVQNLFARVDPNLGLSDSGAILRAASDRNVRTLEEAVCSLAKVFLPTPATIPTDNRDTLYSTLFNVRAKIEELQAFGDSYSIRRIGLDASADLAAARNDLAYRFALRELNPFVVLGFGYSRFNQNGELNLYDPATGQGSLTNEWLTDRAAMLTWKVKLATMDYPTSELTPYVGAGAVSQFFDDRASGTRIYTGVLPLADKRWFVFGTDGDDKGNTALIGSNKNDRLYGGAGDDELRGNGGNDHLEGGSGNDELYGGADNDTLIGGAGDDRLYGGIGFDTYIVGQGTDTLIDEDGRGVVKDGQGREIAGTFIRGADGRYTWANAPAVGATRNSPLTITLENGAQVVLENYDDFAGGELGIRLQDRPLSPATNGFRLGDHPSHSYQEWTGTPALVQGNRYEMGTRDARGRIEYGTTYTYPPAEWINPRIVESTREIIEENDGMVVYRTTNVVMSYTTFEATLTPIYTDDVVPRDDVFRFIYTGGSTVDWRVETGLLSDFVVGGLGNDMIAGGADPDVLLGGIGDDTMFGGDQVDVAGFLEASRTAVGTGLRGDWLSGGKSQSLGYGEDAMSNDCAWRRAA